MATNPLDIFNSYVARGTTAYDKEAAAMNMSAEQYKTEYTALDAYDRKGLQGLLNTMYSDMPDKNVNLGDSKDLLIKKIII